AAWLGFALVLALCLLASPAPPVAEELAAFEGVDDFADEGFSEGVSDASGVVRPAGRSVLGFWPPACLPASTAGSAAGSTGKDVTLPTPGSESRGRVGLSRRWKSIS